MKAACHIAMCWLAFITLLLVAHGCSRTPCTYSVVGVLGGGHTLAVMNDCTGDISLRHVPEDVHMEGQVS